MDKKQQIFMVQFGRSMVEMLGTLAIMGAIGITGIWGFNAAMNSHHANELLYEVNKRANTCVAQINLMGKECNLSEYGDKIENYTTSTLSFPNNYFGIKVAGVPEKICQNIHVKGFPIASQILPETCTTTNEMIFIFDSDLKGGTENLPRQCTPTTKAIDCPYDGSVSCTSDGFCGCQSGSTMTKVGCCPNDKILNGACCRYGIKEENGVKLCCTYQNERCCPSGEIGQGGICRSCDEEAVFGGNWDSFLYRCDACPNRVQAQTWCLLDCLEDDQVKIGGECHCPFERPIMLWQGENRGKCVTCAEGSQYRNASSRPLGYSAEQIARHCNYMGGVSGYSKPCASGQVGLWTNETYTENGEVKTVGYGGGCVSCNSVDTSLLDTRARCESCGGTWESSQPGTQDEWMHGVCKNRQL